MRSTDLHALDSKKTIYFIHGACEKNFFTTPYIIMKNKNRQNKSNFLLIFLLKNKKWLIGGNTIQHIKKWQNE